MKHFKLFFACLLMAVLSIGQVWATDYSFLSSIPSGWQVSPTQNSFESSNNGSNTYGRGAQWSKGADPTISTSSAISGTITQVDVVASTNAGNNKASISVTVGTSTFTPTSTYITSGTASANTTYSFTGSASGNISVTISNTNGDKAVWVSSISVTTSSGGSSNNPTVNVDPTSWGFGSVAANATASKTFSVSGSNLTSGQSLSISVPEGYSVSPNSISVTAATLSATDVTVSKDTETAGTYNGNMSITGAGLSSAKTVGLTMTVTAPAHSYTYNKAFSSTTISDWSSWDNGYSTAHTVNFDIYNEHAGNDCHVYFAGASKQTTTITDKPVAKSGAVNLILDDPNKYISAVKFIGEQWGAKAQTMVLKYSTDGGESWTAFDPAKEATNFVIEELNLPAKVNAVQVAGKNSSNQIGYASVHFDLVNKVSYNINKSETGCTLSVTNGTSAITTAEAGDEVHVSIASTETGYENASFVVKDADNADVTVTNGKFTMPAKAVTITATATETNYTVTVNQNPAVSATTTGQTTAAHYNGTINLTTTVPDGYAFVNWTSSDVTITNPTSATTASFTMPAKNVAVTANFVNASKLNPGFAWSAASAEAVKGQTPYSLPTLSANPHSLTPTYVSTNTDVAEISSAGVVNVKAVGSTTIKATYAEDATYAACEASYTLTVKGRVTWHVIQGSVDDDSEYADYAKDVVPTKPTGITSCHSSISLVGWTTSEYAKSDDAPATLYTGNVPAVTDNADYYAVWANVEEGGWNEITAVANLTAGTYAIYAEGYFLKKEISSQNRFNNGGDGTNVVSEGKLTVTPADNCQWTLSINTSGKYLFQNGDKYAGARDEKNKGALLTDETSDFAQWTITRPSTEFVIENVGRAASSTDNSNAYLRQNGANGWATYVSTTGNAPRFFKYSAGSATGYTTNCVPPMTVATPAFTPNGSAAYYTEAQNVTVSCATEGSVIYYTLDNTTPSKTNGTQYTTAINVAETKTIKAIAYVGDVASEVAEATFTINLPLTTIQGIFDEATAIGSSATQKRTVTFGNWIVSGIGSDDKSVYVTDNTKGFVIYGSGHGFAVGDILSGTVECDLQLYSGFAEIKGLTASNEDLTVTTGGTLVPAAAAIKNLGAVNTGAPVILSNVTYDSDGDLVDDESYYVKPDNMLYSDAVSTFEQDKIYNVTGVYVYGSTRKIAPRSAADIVKLSKEQQTITWYVSNAQAEAIGTSYSLDNKDVAFAPVCVSNSTGAKTYQSSNTEVATINENTGVIEVLGNGVTTITCNVVGDENYVDGSKAFTLKVGVGEASWVATTWATDNSIAANAKMADNSPIAIDANISMTWAKAEGSNDPIYHSDGEGRLYQKNTLTFTAGNSKQITRIEFHFTGTSTGNIGANEGTYSAGVWEGFAPSVIFTNAQGASGAKIKSIDIEYAQGTTTTLTIADMVILNDASATDIVFSSNKPGAVVTYSDYDEDVITIAEGKVSPVAIGNTSVKASIAAEAPYSSVSITFNVRVKSSTETVENVVILSQFGDKWLAMKHDFTAVEVEKAADGTILDLTCDEADITWVMTADGASAMFQAGTDGYMAVGSSNALTLTEDPTIWTLDNDGYYYKETGRTFLYQGNGGKYKSYAASNHGKSADGGYSEYATFVTPVFANRAEIRTAGITSGAWGTICPKKEVKYPAGASFFEISYVEYHSGIPYKVFYDEIAEGASLEAGHPYLFQADEESTAIKGIAVGDDATSAINDHGFIGVLENETISVVQADVDAYKYYIVYNNEIRLCGVGQFLIKAERAYLDLSDPNVEKQYKAPINGRRRVALTNNAPQVATGMDELNASETPVKIMIDGKFYILRGKKMYDATGKLVK